MNLTTRPKILLALMATGILALGALAVSVEAKPGDGQPGPGQGAQDHKDAAQERRDGAQDRREAGQAHKELREDAKEACKAADANSTLAKRCDHLNGAVKARRVAHALLTAIRVHERELGRVDFRMEMVKDQLASGNLTANQTAEAQARLTHLQDRHDKLVQKIKDEQAKLASLRDRWSEVKDHLKDREDAGEDDGGVPADGSDTGSGTATSGDLTTAPPA